MGKRTVNAAKRKRRPRRRSRLTAQSLPALGMSALRLLRNFTFYPKQLSSDRPTTSWLDSLVKYGTIAMKMFLAAVTYERGVGAGLAPHACVQCIAVGPEDLLWSSAIKEVRRIDVADRGRMKTLSCPCIDYRQAHLRQLVVRVSPSAEFAKRGGRICVAIVPLSLNESEKCVTGHLPLAQIDFSQLVQMPGATLVPASRSVVKSWSPKPSDFGFSFREIGDASTPTADVPVPAGGLPVCLVYLGYQSMAGSKPDVTTLYAPEEAVFNVDLSAQVSLREYGTSFIRKQPKPMFETGGVGIIHPDRLIPQEVPLSELLVDNGRIIWRDEHVTQDCLLALGESSSGACSSVASGFEDLVITN